VGVALIFLHMQIAHLFVHQLAEAVEELTGADVEIPRRRPGTGCGPMPSDIHVESRSVKRKPLTLAVKRSLDRMVGAGWRQGWRVV